MHVAGHRLDGARDDRCQGVVHLAIEQDVAAAQQPFQHVLAHLAGQLAPVHIREAARQLVGVVALHVHHVRQHRNGFLVLGRGRARLANRRGNGGGAGSKRGRIGTAGLCHFGERDRGTAGGFVGGLR